MKPKRIQLSRAKGWRMPENTVKIDRATKWGNPFVIGEDGTREECIEKYRRFVAGKAKTERVEVLASRKLVAEHVGDLKGKKPGLLVSAGRSLSCGHPAGTGQSLSGS